MNDNHPITPPPELVEQWIGDWHKAEVKSAAYSSHIATQAAQWGADQELEACCTAIDEVPGGWADSRHLRHVRRPKSPSLKEQALLVIDTAVNDYRMSSDAASIIRRALEALDD